MRVCFMALAALLSWGTEAIADPVPEWALGRWIATSTIEGAERQGFGPNYSRQVSEALAKTQLEIRPDSIAESFSPYNLKFVWGVGLQVALNKVSLKAALAAIGTPFVYGETLAYDPDPPMVAATLTMKYCAEDGGHFETQTTVPIYRFPRIRKSCTQYTLFQFPDDLHIAMWKKDSSGANEGLVIFKKIPKSWID